MGYTVTQCSEYTFKTFSVLKYQSENDAAKNPPPTRLRQPRRAAKAKKCYKELSDSEIESEEASSPHLIKKDLVKRHVRIIFLSIMNF